MQAWAGEEVMTLISFYRFHSTSMSETETGTGNMEGDVISCQRITQRQITLGLLKKKNT